MKTEPRAPYNCTPGSSVAKELSMIMFDEFSIMKFVLDWFEQELQALNLYWVFVSSFHVLETTNTPYKL